MIGALRRIVLPRAIVLETLDALQGPGEDGLEAMVLWLARFRGRDAEVVRAVVPEQTAYRSKAGLSLRVGGDALADLNVELYRTGETLLAQLHTHPTLAYHSEIDDAKPVVTEDGAFSIVVPFFGYVSLPDLTACAVYRLADGQFGRLVPSEVAQIFNLHP